MIHVNSADYSYNAPSMAVLNDCQNAFLPMFDYRPQRSCEGYVFTPVCQSFCSHWGGGFCLSACWDTTPRGADTPQEQTTPPGADTHLPPGSRSPPGADTSPREQTHPPESRQPPREQTTPRETAAAADGTHPTGMHSCFGIDPTQNVWCRVN